MNCEISAKIQSEWFNFVVIATVAEPTEIEIGGVKFVRNVERGALTLTQNTSIMLIQSRFFTWIEVNNPETFGLKNHFLIVAIFKFIVV